MPSTLVARSSHAVAVVLVATTLSFALLQAAGGDVLSGNTSQRGRSTEATAQLRERLGLDDPFTERLVSYLRRTVRGDLGNSFVDGRPVATIVGEAFRNSLLLCGGGLIASLALGMLVGTAQGWLPQSRWARGVGNGLTAVYAIPEFVVAIVLIGVFGYALSILPVGGMTDPLVQLTGTPLQRIMDRAVHLVLPTMTLALAWGASIARQQRLALRDARDAPFVRTARAKGVHASAVLLRHAMRPSAGAVLALLGVMLPVLVGGAVVVEAVYAWPGMGTLILRAVSQRDLPVVGGVTILLAAGVSLGSLVVEIALRALDPRVR